MIKFTVTMLVKGRKVQIYIGSYTAADAFSLAKLLHPNAFVIKAEKVSSAKG